MYPDSETLRNRRIRVLLDNSKYYWLSSIVLALLCLISTSLLSHSLNSVANALYITVLGLIGLYSVHFSQKQLKKVPLWSPELWFACLVAANGVLWGIAGRNDGIYLTLAIAQAALAGLFLASHNRLSFLSITLTALIPTPFLYLNGNPILFHIFLPLMLLIAFISYHGHRMMVRTLRNELESERLTSLLTQNQSELQKKIKKRTHQLEMANQRLIKEVELRKEVNQALILSEEHLNLAMTASGIGFWDWDVPNRKVYHSDTERFFGREESLQSGEFSLLDSVCKDDLPAIRRLLVRHLKDKSTFYQARYRITLPGSDKMRWLEDSGKVTERDDSGRALRMIGTRRDITKDMQLQEELSLSSSLFNNSSEGVFVLDDKQQFRTCNRAFCQIFARQKGELIDRSLFQVIQTDQSDRILHSVGNNDKWYGDIVAARHGEERFPLHLTLTAIRRDDDSISHYLGICRDQSESDQNEREIKYLNNYDKLTGLFNRSYFHQLLNQFQEHQPLSVNNYAVCVLNLDRFKSVNESLGIDVGDQLLKDLSARLSNFSDPVRQVARMSSDEFAMIIEYEKDQDRLNVTLSNLLAEISRPFLVGDHELIVTASIGVCFVQKGNLSQLLNQAIAAMNQARYKGGNNYQFYHQKLATSPLERLQLEKSMRKAIVNHEFSVDYQPKLNLLTGIIDSVEALVRWMHPQKGVIDPEEFIPLAEETGLISAIGEQVLNKACMEAATWRERGFGDISVSVNLSSHQIRRDDLYEVVQNALITSSLPAEYLELELTESMLMEDISHAQDFLNQLRSLGVRLALDDFGTGYSSLSYLKRLPIDTLKIDRSFVNEARDGETSPIVEAIMAMSESLRLSVVAEGVETKEQLEYLKGLGCDYAQGFIISRALPSSEILPLIRHSNLQTLSQTSESVH
ncbi:putative bifunctional diguanylate cyclase/phosphodiesterase [Reinekea marinisedimentorum]|uniref:cyclic-guanylate-specific phosphodiesterase n=1 Tax=Reinekea marinisedimentorum TaxID=230495 RepID=A0A4R3IDY3_9GAMM|nr:GGDEF domain-containing phosphodiesterase [Reinekea marinisedimentorum]TCS44084.1 PAS domain S-box-containing protein/diguanylate cyclase (GGDEF)-like protein [Reinekea marinisedimentorum]